ncbi:MAG: hypothetical protein ACKV2Q_04045 [Planctomycetaceae bacterium]
MSPEVARQLVEMARQMRSLVYGGDGVPVWGTKFFQIESEAMSVAHEFGRLMMEQAVEGQAKQLPDQSRKVPDETAAVTGTAPAVLETLVFVGVLLKSFPQASCAILKLLEIAIGRERLERLTEGIGLERIEQTYLRNSVATHERSGRSHRRPTITSCHMESTMKELNDRLKGTESSAADWSDEGGEALLQLRADSLCDSAPLETFWQKRLSSRSGYHSCTNRRPHNNQLA